MVWIVFQMYWKPYSVDLIPTWIEIKRFKMFRVLELSVELGLFCQYWCLITESKNLFLFSNVRRFRQISFLLAPIKTQFNVNFSEFESVFLELCQVVKAKRVVLTAVFSRRLGHFLKIYYIRPMMHQSLTKNAEDIIFSSYLSIIQLTISVVLQVEESWIKASEKGAR